MILYRFKITFEDVDDVERVVDIRANQTFRDLYRIIVESILFDPLITASFYISGDNWRKGREITNADKGEEVLQMGNSKLNTFVNDPHQKILLITHDVMEWTLRLQLIKIQKADEAKVYPSVVKTVGVAPAQKKVVSIGLATNEFEAMVDEIVREEEEPDISEMGFDDGGADEDDVDTVVDGDEDVDLVDEDADLDLDDDSLFAADDED